MLVLATGVVMLQCWFQSADAIIVNEVTFVDWSKHLFSYYAPL